MSSARVPVPLLLFSFLGILLASCGGENGGMPSPSPTPSATATPTGTPTSLALQPFVSGLDRPVDFQVPDDNSGRIFIVEQGGTIRIVSGGTLQAGSFLDITGRVRSGGELGLLGLAFHPGFGQSGRFYVNYTREEGGQLQSVIAEYAVSGDPDRADPASERILLTVDQPFPNHKAGQLAFGPADGFLYFGLGDGGGSGDPNENAQDVNTLLGKMLRVDVDGTSTGRQYAIPADNPFAGGGGRPEIWALGFRNPWRFSFDPQTGRQFVADVGQERFEEIDLVTRGGNYGWDTMEGAHCFEPSTGCNTAGLTPPIFEYTHDEGNSVIGGYVYRGTALPGLQGTYVFGDLSGGKLWGLTEQPGGTWTRRELLSHTRTVTSLGQDAAGELYLIDIDGVVLRIVAE